MSDFPSFSSFRSESLACQLTSPELAKRKRTVMTELKKQGLKSKEIANGFAYKFKGGDGVIDQLSEFIKTEHHCCAFLKFNLFIGKESECN